MYPFILQVTKARQQSRVLVQRGVVHVENIRVPAPGIPHRGEDPAGVRARI